MATSHLAEAITDLGELCQVLKLPKIDAADAHSVYPLLVPRNYIDKIEKGNINDPLLLQILPQNKELDHVPGFTADPLGEMRPTCSLKPGIVQKYHGRALVLATNSCAVHCRYCFRRGRKEGFLSDDCDFTDIPVSEIILSGGDPLALSDREFGNIVAKIKQNRSVKIIRIHTRFPVMTPNRITDELISVLSDNSQVVFYMVLHINHPREIDEAFLEKVSRLSNHGVPLLSQTVLLRNVNDDFSTLYELFSRLISVRIIPYYLHQLDRVSGASHFEVAASKGLELIKLLKEHLPGYAIPRYVREIPDAPFKSEHEAEL